MSSDNYFIKIEEHSLNIIKQGGFLSEDANSGLGSLSLITLLAYLAMGMNKTFNDKFKNFIGTQRHPILADTDKNKCFVKLNYNFGLFSNLVNYFTYNNGVDDTLKLESGYFILREADENKFEFTKRFMGCSEMLFLSGARPITFSVDEYGNSLNNFLGNTQNNSGMISYTEMQYSESSRVALSFVNKISYKNYWKEYFNDVPTSETFHNKNGNQVSVKYMDTTQEMHYLSKNNNFQMIAVPFDSDDDYDMDMILILPESTTDIKKLIIAGVNPYEYLPKMFEYDDSKVVDADLTIEKKNINLKMPIIDINVTKNDVLSLIDPLSDLNFSSALDISQNSENMFINPDYSGFSGPAMKTGLSIQVNNFGSGKESAKPGAIKRTSRQGNSGSSAQKINIDRGFAMMFYSHRLRHPIFFADINTLVEPT